MNTTPTPPVTPEELRRIAEWHMGVHEIVCSAPIVPPANKSDHLLISQALTRWADQLEQPAPSRDAAVREAVENVVIAWRGMAGETAITREINRLHELVSATASPSRAETK